VNWKARNAGAASLRHIKLQVFDAGRFAIDDILFCRSADDRVDDAGCDESGKKLLHCFDRNQRKLNSCFLALVIGV
jgi:hypothetical protein